MRQAVNEDLRAGFFDGALGESFGLRRQGFAGA